MNNTREKLIELVGKVQDCGCDVTDVVAMNYVENETLGDYLIANGVTIQKWISVTKMVPESHVERMDDLGETLYFLCSDFVLGYTDHGQFVCVQHLVEDEKDYWIDDFGTEYTVTHWMPLPEKPEGV